MTKDQFLSKLDSALKGLPSSEKQDILQDYEEHFTLAMEEGKSEGEIAERLGAPAQIAKEILASYHLEKVDKHLTTGNIFRAVWAVIGLGFFNLVIVLGPFITLVGIMFSLWMVALSFTCSPILILFDFIFSSGGFEFFSLFATIALSGFGLLIGIVMFYITKVLTHGFIRYLKFNMSLVKGGLKHE